MSFRRHIIVGVSAAVFLLLVYAGVIALAQGWQHMVEQTARLWYWIIALTVGFGIQAGLFSFIRQALRERSASATASVATSGGVSAGSMIACCAHHLGDVLPLIGVAGLTALLVKYQSFFIILGTLSNIVGISIMLDIIQRHGLCLWVANWKWDMGRVTKGVMASAVIILIITGVRTLAGS